MNECEHHGKYNDGSRYWPECPICVREERDRLRAELVESKANAESWRQQNEERIDEALRLGAERDRYRKALGKAKAFVLGIANQGDSKPDYWSSCLQCEQAKEDAKGVLENLKALEGKE